MILVITSKKDSHVGAVSRHFDYAGVPWVRLNTEDFAVNTEVTVSPADGSGTIFVRDSGRTVRIEEVRAVWFRKPEPVNVLHFSDMEAGALDYVDAEFGELLLNLYSLLSHVHWINDPFSTRIAHRKMLQLRTAAQVGFTTPRTLITNNPEAALAFAEGLRGDIAIKSLGAITVTEPPSGDGSAVQYGLFTRRVTLAELKSVKNTIHHLPTAFQEFLEKRYEIRISCVGSRCFACRIEPRGGDLTADDYRFDTRGLIHTPQECPELEEKLRAYMQAFGLNFGCFDILVTKAGEPVFLECNANGQFQWIEKMTGLPIAEAVAQQLISAHEAAEQREVGAGGGT
jgi:glutathione synthase/RimK-type ligase-like ATP-grasp enzyme